MADGEVFGEADRGGFEVRRHSVMQPGAKALGFVDEAIGVGEVAKRIGRGFE